MKAVAHFTLAVALLASWPVAASGDGLIASQDTWLENVRFCEDAYADNADVIDCLEVEWKRARTQWLVADPDRPAIVVQRFGAPTMGRAEPETLELPVNSPENAYPVLYFVCRATSPEVVFVISPALASEQIYELTAKFDNYSLQRLSGVVISADRRLLSFIGLTDEGRKTFSRFARRSGSVEVAADIDGVTRKASFSLAGFEEVDEMFARRCAGRGVGE